jgi:hypothetical protein
MVKVGRLHGGSAPVISELSLEVFARAATVSGGEVRPQQRSKKARMWVRWLNLERRPLTPCPTRLSRNPLWDQGPITSSLPAHPKKEASFKNKQVKSLGNLCR